MSDIIPAILPESYERLRAQLQSMHGVAHTIQIDIVDGTFAANKTWPYTDENFQFSTFNFKTIAPGIEVEIDLMAQEPQDAAEAWRRAGARRIIIHADASGAREALLSLRFDKEEKNLPNVLAGIALPSSATSDALREFENLYDYIQVMGIEKVGFQGQPFDPRAVELVRNLRKQNPQLPIQVDGGVGEDNARELAQAGASRLIVGHVIWESDNSIEEIEKLYKLAN